MYVKARVHAEAKEAEIVKKKNGSYEVHVRAPKKDGRANKEALSLLAGELGTKKLRIKSGHTKPNKIIEIYD